MATNNPQGDFQKQGLRLPRALHLDLHAAAVVSGRSYNSEIVARLMQTFPVNGAAFPELAAYPSAALLAEIGRRCP